MSIPIAKCVIVSSIMSRITGYLNIILESLVAYNIEFCMKYVIQLLLGITVKLQTGSLLHSRIIATLRLSLLSKSVVT